METHFYFDQIRKERQREFLDEVNHSWILKQVHAQQPGFIKSCLDSIVPVMTGFCRRFIGALNEHRTIQAHKSSN